MRAAALNSLPKLNGRTIGSSTSGATERAKADTQALFLYLWAADATLTVSGGRTTAAADYAANKTITLPDGRGRAITGLDDMGNSAAGRLTAAYVGASGGCSGVLGTTLGAACGGESQTLTLAQLPTGITSANAAQAISVTSTPTNVVQGVQATNGSAGGGGAGLHTLNSDTYTAIVSTGNNAISVTSSNTSGTAHNNTQPTILVTIYIKL